MRLSRIGAAIAALAISGSRDISVSRAIDMPSGMNEAQMLMDEFGLATMRMRATARVMSRIPAKGRRGGAMAHRRWKKQRASGRA